MPSKTACLFVKICLGLGLVASGVVHAQFKNSAAFYGEAKKGVSSEAGVGADLFGESVNLQDGTTSFRHVDISLVSNSKIPIIIGRKFSGKKYSGPAGVDPASEVFGNSWLLDVPYMMGTFDSRDGWVSTLPDSGTLSGRCTAGTFSPRGTNGPWPYYNNTYIGPENFWNGTAINVPGYGEEQLLVKTPNHVMPSDGLTYYGVTRSNWRVSCLPNIKNGSGEGFLVRMPDGTKYYFDWMVSRKVADLTDGSSAPSDPWHLLIPRTDVFLYATRAEDRFGNWVEYQYDQGNPQRLLSIASNDGVLVSLSYASNGKVSTITVNGRTWSYEYVQESEVSVFLSKVTLPDQSKWTYSFNQGTTVLVPGQPGWDQCNEAVGNLSTQVPIDESTLPTLSIGHPSGAQGEFKFRRVVHGTNNTPGECIVSGNFQSGFSIVSLGTPRAYSQLSIVKKTISGPGMAPRVWNFSYYPSWSFAKDCGNGCAETSETRITDPNGVVRKLVYGNSYSKNAGQLLSEVVEKSGVTYKTTSYTYMSSAVGQSFPEIAGTQPRSRNNPFLFKNLPMVAQSIVQDGVSYHTTFGGHDGFIRPTTSQIWNSLNVGSKTVATEYSDSIANWVLGNVLRTTTNGVSTASTTFDPIMALPIATYKFDKLQGTATYNANGTLATSSDGRGNITAFGNWKRGIPQLITHPGGASQSATVSDSGWITSITDENGFVTGYGYDAMGRLASVVQPTGDTLSDGATAYHSTWSHFGPVLESDWRPTGVSTGQWRKVEGTGLHIKITYMNAMLQPILVHEYDQANVATSLRASRTEYDNSGRVSFQSYPSSEQVPGAIGKRTFYDALDRVIRVEQDSELSVLSTTTEYLSGLRTRVTSPRGQQVTTSFMAWDQPSYELPILSEQPEGKVIQIDRHPQFGWPLVLTQRNAANTQSATRRYVYDGNAQLCKTIEPEAGVAVMGYDAAGNLAWSAAGLDHTAFGSVSDCQHNAAYASGRTSTRVYDTRNRLTHLIFPDGRGNQVLTYTPDGLPASITTYNGTGNSEPVLMAYTYNKRRLLTGESITQYNGTTPWYTWTIGYAYNGYGHLSTQTYPTGLVVDYAPNPLGQPTRAGTYATGAQYYPNGALKQFTYGNGIVHTMTQNARQLPAQVISAGVSNYTYNYDNNGNVTNIWDLARGDHYSRWLQYDQLDRLTSAGSGSFGGDAWHRMTYDALDNLKSWKLAGVKDYADYIYDAQNRLTNIRNTAGATVVGIDYDEQGNLRNKNGQAYVFDYGNRLRSATGKETYRYDGLGRRVQTTATNGKTTLWQYTQGGHMLFSSDWGDPASPAQQTHENVYLAGSIVAIIDHAWPSNAVLATRYQHTDALGSPVAVTNASGQVIERMDYEPWGAIIGKPNHNGIGYTGHVMDGATGLTYMQQRYYDQSVGRFLSVDPVTAYEKPMTNFNRYFYTLNNPYKYTDPDGRDVFAELRAYVIGEAPIQGEYGHQYLYLRDTVSGAEMISRAGPSAPYSGGSVAVVSGSAVEDPSGNGNVTLVTELGPAVASVDADANRPGEPASFSVRGSQVVIPGNIQQAAARLQGFNNQVEAAQIDYKPLSTNSNAYAGTAYSELTGRRAPSSDLLPGSDVDLREEMQP